MTTYGIIEQPFGQMSSPFGEMPMPGQMPIPFGNIHSGGSVAGIILRRVEAHRYFPLSSDTEQPGNELRLPCRVPAVQSLNLSLPHHVHDLDTFYCPLRSVKRPEALRRSPPASDRAVFLLINIVQVFNAPQLTIRW